MRQIININKLQNIFKRRIGEFYNNEYLKNNK